MKSILDWQPEKGRLWPSARIENIQYLREDLATLAEWLKEKADRTALAAKADAAKLTELETAFSAIQARLESLQDQAASAAQQAGQRLTQLEEKLWAGEALLQSAAAARDGAEKSAALASEHAANGQRRVEESSAAALECSRVKQECTELSRGLMAQINEGRTLSDQLRETLTGLAAEVEQNARHATAQSQLAQTAVQGCETATETIRRLTSSTEERLTELVRTAEAHASTSTQQAQAANQATDLARSLRLEAEGLIQSFQLKLDELSSLWQTTEKEFTQLSGTTEGHARAAAEAAARSEQILTESKAGANASGELLTSLHAQRDELAQRLARLDQELREAGQQAAQSRASAEQCRELSARVQAAVQSVEAQVQQTQSSLATLRQGTETFWGRLRWLFTGNRAR